jgi:hypothetical protein
MSRRPAYNYINTPTTDSQYQGIPRVLMRVWWDDDRAQLPWVTALLPKPFTASLLLDLVQQHGHEDDSARPGARNVQAAPIRSG